MTIRFGKHTIGNFYFFSQLIPASHRWLVHNEKEAHLLFENHESIMEFVVNTHESYYIMQSHLLGVSYWLQKAQDFRTAAVVSYIKENINLNCVIYPLLPSERVDHTKVPYKLLDCFKRYDYCLNEVEFSNEQFDSPETTKQLIIESIGNIKIELARLPENMFRLTCSHLFECQAALLTEIRLSTIMTAIGESLDNKFIKEMVPCFRVEELDNSISLPLKVFRDFFHPIYHESYKHPLYHNCPNIIEYSMLLFLIDLALHIPSRSMVVYPYDTLDINSKEDTYPPTRYFCHIIQRNN